MAANRSTGRQSLSVRPFLTRVVAIVAIIAGSLIWGAALGAAQSPTGVISGRVLDASGAVIPGVDITVTNRETGFVRTAITNEQGRYSLPALPVGIYDIRAELPSFRPEVQQGLTLAVGQEAVINFALAVGSITDLVEVRADAALVETTSATIGGVISEVKITELPLNGRNFNSLVLLSTGIEQVTSSSPGTTAISRGFMFSANGASVRSNYQVMDGANLTSAKGSSGVSVSGAMLGVDAIREFRVIVGYAPAEYGMTMGSQMLIVSKGGTNEFHGNLFEFLRNSAMDARNFFDRKLKDDDPRLPPFRRNNFGGSFGGPIRQDKLFFFGNYEGIRESRSITQTLTTINAQARQDGFLVPRIADVIKPYLALYPLPTEPFPTDLTGVTGLGRYTYVFKRPAREEFLQGRVDWNISQRDNTFVRYTFSDGRRDEPVSFPQFTAIATSRGHFVTFGENHTFSPTLLNTIRFSYSNIAGPTVYNIVTDPAFEKQLSPLLFTPGADGEAWSFSPGSGVTSMGQRYGPPGLQPTQNVYTFSSDLFWTHGVHAVKTGTLINRYRSRLDTTDFNAGSYTFSNLRSFLLGTPRQYSIHEPRTWVNEWAFSTFGFYLQDDWRVLPNLTLNLGLRYEPKNTVTEITGHNSTLINRLTDSEFTVTPVLFKNPSLKNFGPRVAFAWDVTGNATTAIRGGIGLMYDVASFISAAATARDRPPFIYNTSLTTGLTFPRTVVPLGLGGRSVEGVDYYAGQPRMWHYNFTIDQALPASMALSLSYAGSRGSRIANMSQGNPVPPTAYIDGKPFWGPNAPRVNPHWDTYSLKTTTGKSWYDSAQIRLQKNLSSGLQYQTSYTWAKALDTTQGNEGGENLTSSGTTYAQAYDIMYDKGPADFDRRHSWTTNMLYEIPSLNLGGVGRILDGWRLSTIFSLKSGNPFTPTLSGGRSRSNGAAGGGTDRPDIVPGRNNSNITKGSTAGCLGVAPQKLGTPDMYFDPCAYTIQPVGFLGNSSRGHLTGPKLVNWDFSVTKQAALSFLGEEGGLEFRAEFFNFLNHPTFLPPSSGVYTVDETTIEPRVNPTAGLATRTGSTARQIQLGLKLIF